MELVYYKMGTSQPLGLACTEDGKIDFALLGGIFGLDPATIKLNGVGFPRSRTEPEKSEARWAAIKTFFGRDTLGATIGDPVEVTGKAPGRSGDGYNVQDALSETSSYFEGLLEPPPHLPTSTDDLREFLATRTDKLPLANEPLLTRIKQPTLLKPPSSKAESTMAGFVEAALQRMAGSPPLNEASSSAQLVHITGFFLEQINECAPTDRQVRSLDHLLDSTNPRASETTTIALLPMLRPDFQFFVNDVLMLRWENKFDVGDMNEAAKENVSKLKVWSPLYYGTLPYVIGGCCAGRQFRWLKLSPNGERIVADIISDVYDLTMLSGVALFLHSIIRMHCLLQKLQRELGDHTPVRLYKILRRNGGEVVIYPDFVHKVLRPPLAEAKFDKLQSLYASIEDSRYLIHLEHGRTGKGATHLQLKPVGDLHAEPGVLEDLTAAIHDILYGLIFLHGAGYTHRDLKWENCIKVNVESESKWVIIDLEAAGPDQEEWVGDELTSWDEGTLEERNGKRIYTKGSDMYQLGKIIMEWLDRPGGKESDLYRMGENMQRERTAATTVIEQICKPGCQRCGKFGKDKSSTVIKDKSLTRSSGRPKRKASGSGAAMEVRHSGVTGSR